jgi:hypothetical protein
MKISDALPSKYLKAEDLEGANVTVTIEEVNREEVGPKKELKLVISFANTRKKMVLNKTNAATIAKLYGEETDEWLGKRIILYSKDTEFQGEMVLALRVSLQKPTGTQKPSSDDKGRLLSDVNPPPDAEDGDPF